MTLTVPWTHNRFGDRSFAVAGPRLWNSLPLSLWQISSYGQFRRYLKNHLFGIWEITAQCDAWFSAQYKYSYLLTYLINLLRSIRSRWHLKVWSSELYHTSPGVLEKELDIFWTHHTTTAITFYTHLDIDRRKKAQWTKVACIRKLVRHMDLSSCKVQWQQTRCCRNGSQNMMYSSLHRTSRQVYRLALLAGLPRLLATAKRLVNK